MPPSRASSGSCGPVRAGRCVRAGACRCVADGQQASRGLAGPCGRRLQKWRRMRGRAATDVRRLHSESAPMGEMTRRPGARCDMSSGRVLRHVPNVHYDMSSGRVPWHVPSAHRDMSSSGHLLGHSLGGNCAANRSRRALLVAISVAAVDTSGCRRAEQRRRSRSCRRSSSLCTDRREETQQSQPSTATARFITALGSLRDSNSISLSTRRQ